MAQEAIKSHYSGDDPASFADSESLSRTPSVKCGSCSVLCIRQLTAPLSVEIADL